MEILVWQFPVVETDQRHRQVNVTILFAVAPGVQNEKFRDGGLADRNIENPGVPHEGSGRI